MNFNLYQAPEIQQVFSIPITLIDGTSSMNREYKYIIQAYEQIFGDLLETQKISYQWSINLKSIKPYLNDERGNLTMALAELFQLMVTKQFPTQYVTIILVTDGREPFDINAIMELCQQIKSHYTVQFFCIAFGNQFPITLYKILKESIENQDFKNQSLFQIERSDYQSYVQIQKGLKQAFQQIRKNLIMTSKYHFLNFEIFTSITLRQPQKYVASNELFLACRDQEIKIEEQQLVSINSPISILQFLRKSISNIYGNLDLLQGDQIIQEFQQTFNFFNQYIINVESKEEYAQQLKIINLILKMIQQIEFSYYNEDQIKSLQYIEQCKYLINCDNPKNFEELLDNSDIGKNESHINKIILYIKTRFQNLLNQNTYNNQQNHIDFFLNYRTIIIYSINNICQVFENIEPINLEKTQKEFQNLRGSLIQHSKEVFSSEYFDISTNDQYQQLVQINEQFRYLEKLQTETNLNEIKLLIHEIKTLNLENQNQIDSYFQFSYLPIFNQKNNESIYEKYLIFIIDKDEELKIYTDSFLQCYSDIFSKISPKKRLDVFWQNNPTTNFKILNNQESEKTQFQSFKLLLDSLKDKFELKRKQIQLLILTDNEQSYAKLHLQIKFAQISNYNFKIIYISIGMKILSYLQNLLNSNIDQQFLCTNPLIKNIPKQQFTKSTNQEQNQQRRNNYQKIIQEIASQIDIMNF